MKPVPSLLLLLAFVLALHAAGACAPAKPHNVTVTGTVQCAGRPVQGVAVSDGCQVALTDRTGTYRLASCKTNPQVFVTLPSGYEIDSRDVVPRFWADFTAGPDTLERHDFALRSVDQSRHAVLLVADVQLAHQRGDVAIFTGEYLPRLRAEADSLRALGMAVYSINLGDGSWDKYWAAHHFGLSDFKHLLDSVQYPTPLYSVMGNHDNDPTAVCDSLTDLRASLPYQRLMGPRYYSHNIGGVHYVFLDNVHYINTPAGQPAYHGVDSKRDYTEDFTPEQLAWLRKDLALVSRDTPVVVAMHGPMFRWKRTDPAANPAALTDSIIIRTDLASTRQLLDILRPYGNVHTVSGHSHKQCLVRLPKGMQPVAEHNISGICGAWWRTRATGLKNLCPDGTPAGYEVLLADGDSLQWRHRTFEYDPSRQFYAWDMNGVKRYFATDPEARAFLTMYPRWSGYRNLPDNYIYVNLWEWDPAGHLSVTEQGRELPVEMVEDENPLFTASYIIRNTVWDNNWNDAGYAKPRRFQLFRAQTSDAATPVTVTWTDPFGNSSSMRVDRPAPFTLEKL